MKKFLPVLLLLLFAFSCKKDKTTLPIVPISNDIDAGGDSGTEASAPALKGMSATIVTAGMSIVITGVNLPSSANDVKVLFNEVSAPITFIQKSSIVVTVPVTTNGIVKVTIGNDTLTGPAFSYVTAPKITGISTSVVTTGTIVTIIGTNFQSNGLTTAVKFNYVSATLQSITPTEIKAVVPKTSNGIITVELTPDIRAIGPAFSYNAPELLIPYNNGNVTLNSQSDVDIFAKMNKDRQIEITGDLLIQGTDITSVSDLAGITSVSGKISIDNAVALTEAPFLDEIKHAGHIEIKYSGLSSLSFRKINNFSGYLRLSHLDKLRNVTFYNLTNPSSITIRYTPLITDISFLDNIISTGGIYLSYAGASALNLDKLTTISNIDIYTCESLKTISMRSLTRLVGGALSLRNCTSLSDVNFQALTTNAQELIISGSRLTNMNGFRSMQSSGSIMLLNNPLLADLRGLSNLTKLTLPALGAFSADNTLIVAKGIDIQLNPMLTSLAGLENVVTVPILTITRNNNLNDLCALKKPIIALSTLPAFSYRYVSPYGSGPPDQTRYIDALTLSDNGNYPNTQDGLVAVTKCN